MKILDDLISTLDSNVSVRDVRQGIFHTRLLTRYYGLAATLPRDALRQEPPLVKEPGLLPNKTPRELARMAYSERILEAAIGMATINSLLEVDLRSCIELNAADLILEKGQAKRVAIVGHFPFLSRVREKTKSPWVIEKNPREGDSHESEADLILPEAEVVGITGTSLTNHTFEHPPTLCNLRVFVVMLGNTVPLSSDLFRLPSWRPSRHSGDRARARPSLCQPGRQLQADQRHQETHHDQTLSGCSGFSRTHVTASHGGILVNHAQTATGLAHPGRGPEEETRIIVSGRQVPAPTHDGEDLPDPPAPRGPKTSGM